MAIKCFGEKELAYLRQVVESQSLWRGTGEGSMAARFEDAFAAHLGRRYVLALSSGTSANEAAYAALGLEPGDEVICPGVAPIFVSFPVVSIVCVPVFADVDERTLTVSPEGIEAAITPRAKAVVVVHLNGQPADMDGILAVARQRGLKVVEDCAQCFDGLHKGRKSGTMGDVACFSLQQAKHITSGEGGMVATDDPDMYCRAVLYSNCGMAWYRYGLEAPKPEPLAGLPTRGHFAWGHNLRMGDLAAAAALAQLERLDEFNARRRRLVEIIEEILDGAPGIGLAYRLPETVPNYWKYPLRVPEALSTLVEINYLEVAFQQMQATRRTPVGAALPDYVQYKPGLCPNAEAAARQWGEIWPHHRKDPDDIRAEALALRRRAEELAGEK